MDKILNYNIYVILLVVYIFIYTTQYYIYIYLYILLNNITTWSQNNECVLLIVVNITE